MDKNIYTHFVVFVTSFSLLFYQITLTRIFSITKWYNLVSIIITIALLGFAISGTIIALIKNQIVKHFNLFNFAALLLFPLSISLSFIIYLKIPFNPYELDISAIQLIYLLLYCIIITIPFLIGAFIIGIAIYKFKANTIYGVNMFGSGLGALAVIISLNWLSPFTLILIISIISTVSPLLYLFFMNNKLKLIPILSLLLIYNALLFLNFNNLTNDSISQYKPISKTLLLPESKVEILRYSPLSVIKVVSAKGLRSVSGLSLGAPYEVPEQKTIFFDGSGSSNITPYKGDLNDIKYLSFIPSSLPYELIEPTLRSNLLIVGVGGGEGLLKGELYNFKNIEGVEIDNNVVSIMQNEYSNFSGNLYNKSNTQIHSKEAREFIRNSHKRYDLIDISMIDAYNRASSGIYAMNETYLYTVESIQNFYSKLSDNGILSISRWINIPPKNCIKMMNICINALKKEGIENIEDHILFIRSIQSATLLISKIPFSNSQIQMARDFCNSKHFDLIYHRGIKRSDVNKFIKFKTAIYYNSAKYFLYPKEFKHTFNFDISPATDDKPYFYNFFNYNMFKDIVSGGVQKVPVTEWGYFILILILIPVIFCGLLFIIVPLIFINKDSRISSKEALLFSLLGIGFFFIEMPLIQKFILFLAHPIYSVSIIITTLLISSGIGSFFSSKIFNEKRRILYCGISISIIILFYIFLFNSILLSIFSLPVFIKALFTIIMIFPLGFLMGIPFPNALSQIKKHNPQSYPWAWGINGFFSVISIIIATILSIKFGLTTVFIIATICYLLAGVISLKLFSCRWN